MVSTQQLVSHDVTEERLFSSGCGVTHDNGLALEHHLVVHQSSIVGGACTTPAASLHLHFDALVGDFQHAPGAVKEQPAKVGNETEGVDVDAEVIDDGGEFVTLFDRVELHFVAHQVVEWHMFTCQCNQAWCHADVHGWG